MPSENVENYLKTIYALQSDGGRVTTSSLSERLGISAASVTEMVQKLADEGDVHYQPRKGVELTEDGRKRAVRIIRRHRLWELFLVRVLKYEWHEIHDEAERLEHSTSEKLEKHLDAALGYPTIDPHGDLIPNARGTIVQMDLIPMAAAEPGSTVRVLRVSDASREILQYAARLGITLRKEVKVCDRVEFDGSLRILISGVEHFISGKLAGQIWVEPVSVASGRSRPATNRGRLERGRRKKS